MGSLKRVLQDASGAEASQLWLVPERVGLAEGTESIGAASGRRNLQEGVLVDESAKTFRHYCCLNGS